MQNYNEIIEKLKDILSQEHGNKKVLDKDVAAALGIEETNFRKQKHRNSIPYFEIMSFLAKRNISINWFFFNQLPESLIESTSNYIILKYQRTVTASAGGGAINYELDSTPLVIDKQLLDHINSRYKYTEVIKVFGESMEPDIKDESLVFIDKSKTDINSTGVYLINTNDGLYIKCIKVENDKVILKSNNQAFDDITLHIDDVDIVGRVCGVLVKV
ncbi:putative phage repressor [Arcobacter nitrofigilis DSM 7299]|uniref:Putative phage repressor n=1 Tax=Arcobacter nitrofigilis (strain ATCC 33309 / DSM 7299 / CCUG 15893 / LMG 7604 / NCTC 12251 / CI) TaxID=572480 RepID=D5V3T3_ARCNC|nr:S24 family peptidase [Arcobacter nitrofigilis]ADG92761.1 putative phage repressor [Arcobacter nitrofigilis DSM 7299]